MGKSIEQTEHWQRSLLYDPSHDENSSAADVVGNGWTGNTRLYRRKRGQLNPAFHKPTPAKQVSLKFKITNGSREMNRKIPAKGSDNPEEGYLRLDAWQYHIPSSWFLLISEDVGSYFQD